MARKIACYTRVVYKQRRRRPLRMPSFDYASDGAYFVTICVQDRRCLLGDIVDEKASLSAAGQLVAAGWQNLAARFPSVHLDAFVVMPNHVHGIMWLTDPADAPEPNGARMRAANHLVGVRRAPPCDAEGGARDAEGGARDAEGGASPTPTESPASKKRPTLGQVIGAFKSISTVQVNRLHDTQGQPLWQRNYYERVVRNEAELLRFRKYIAENPARWPQDPDHPSNLRRTPGTR